VLVLLLRIEMAQGEEETPIHTIGLEARVIDVVEGQGRSFYKFNPLHIRDQEPDDLNYMSEKTLSGS
jgi:hypothetical protein